MKRLFLTIFSLILIALLSSVFSIESTAVTQIIGSIDDTEYLNSESDGDNTVIIVDGSGGLGGATGFTFEYDRCFDMEIGVSGVTQSNVGIVCRNAILANANICPSGRIHLQNIIVAYDPGGGEISETTPQTALCQVPCCKKTAITTGP